MRACGAWDRSISCWSGVRAARRRPQRWAGRVEPPSSPRSGRDHGDARVSTHRLVRRVLGGAGRGRGGCWSAATRDRQSRTLLCSLAQRRARCMPVRHRRGSLAQVRPRGRLGCAGRPARRAERAWSAPRACRFAGAESYHRRLVRAVDRAHIRAGRCRGRESRPLVRYAKEPHRRFLVSRDQGAHRGSARARHMVAAVRTRGDRGSRFLVLRAFKTSRRVNEPASSHGRQGLMGADPWRLPSAAARRNRECVNGALWARCRWSRSRRWGVRRRFPPAPRGLVSNRPSGDAAACPPPRRIVPLPDVFVNVVAHPVRKRGRPACVCLLSRCATAAPGKTIASAKSCFRGVAGGPTARIDCARRRAGSAVPSWRSPSAAARVQWPVVCRRRWPTP